ncbi:MAG: hypothetical protein KW788_01325 [Candidatus Doudnabacteria bacterium]|nr:hypothetical protein [Candidatus Doudnabacteria bacterium]
MSRNRTIGLIILVLVITGIVWLVYYNNHKNDNSNTNPDLSVTVVNSTQNADGSSVVAHPKDQLVYTLNAHNPSDKVISGYVMEVGIADVTKAATLIDAQQANYNSANNSLIWTPLDIPANESIQKQFTVRVKDSLPANASDRILKVSFNNEVTTALGESTTATTSRPGSIGSGATYTAPKTGIPGWISFYLAAFITFGVMLFRLAAKLGKPTN